MLHNRMTIKQEVKKTLKYIIEPLQRTGSCSQGREKSFLEHP